MAPAKRPAAKGGQSPPPGKKLTAALKGKARGKAVTAKLKDQGRADKASPKAPKRGAAITVAESGAAVGKGKKSRDPAEPGAASKSKDSKLAAKRRREAEADEEEDLEEETPEEELAELDPAVEPSEGSERPRRDKKARGNEKLNQSPGKSTLKKKSVRFEDEAEDKDLKKLHRFYEASKDPDKDEYSKAASLVQPGRLLELQTLNRQKRVTGSALIKVETVLENKRGKFLEGHFLSKEGEPGRRFQKLKGSTNCYVHLCRRTDCTATCLEEKKKGERTILHVKSWRYRPVEHCQAKGKSPWTHCAEVARMLRQKGLGKEKEPLRKKRNEPEETSESAIETLQTDEEANRHGSAPATSCESTGETDEDLSLLPAPDFPPPRDKGGGSKDRSALMKRLARQSNVDLDGVNKDLRDDDGMPGVGRPLQSASVEDLKARLREPCGGDAAR